MRTSCIFKRSPSPSGSFSKNSASASGRTLYCISSEIRDFTSPTYPILFMFTPRTFSSAFFCSATLRRTRFFPVSSSTTTFCFPRSSKTRYASLAKLSTSTFIIACCACLSTNSRCVCMVNCSGTMIRNCCSLFSFACFSTELYRKSDFPLPELPNINCRDICFSPENSILKYCITHYFF